MGGGEEGRSLFTFSALYIRNPNVSSRFNSILSDPYMKWRMLHCTGSLSRPQISLWDRNNCHYYCSSPPHTYMLIHIDKLIIVSHAVQVFRWITSGIEQKSKSVTWGAAKMSPWFVRQGRKLQFFHTCFNVLCMPCIQDMGFFFCMFSTNGNSIFYRTEPLKQILHVELATWPIRLSFLCAAGQTGPNFLLLK